jgi:hypothetical protein
MKVVFFEGEYGANIDLIPETIEETTALARMTINSKANKPEIRLYLFKEPCCSIWVKSVAKVARKGSITNLKNKP